MRRSGPGLARARDGSCEASSLPYGVDIRPIAGDPRSPDSTSEGVDGPRAAHRHGHVPSGRARTTILRPPGTPPTARRSAHQNAGKPAHSLAAARDDRRLNARGRLRREVHRTKPGFDEIEAGWHLPETLHRAEREPVGVAAERSAHHLLSLRLVGAPEEARHRDHAVRPPGRPTKCCVIRPRGSGTRTSRAATCSR